MIGFDPTPEQEALREMVHKFAANEIRPRAAEWTGTVSSAGSVPEGIRPGAHDRVHSGKPRGQG